MSITEGSATGQTIVYPKQSSGLSRCVVSASCHAVVAKRRSQLSDCAYRLRAVLRLIHLTTVWEVALYENANATLFLEASSGCRYCVGALSATERPQHEIGLIT